MADSGSRAELRVGITLTRTFDAPRDEVWKEWTEPARFADWYGGAEAEIPIATVSMDVREGGSWRATMVVDGGRREIHWHGTYLEVVEPERLVLTLSDQPPDVDRYEVVTVELSDLGDGRTEMRFEQRGHLPAPTYRRAAEGWGAFFARMEQRLSER
jgi:uncharacterized protein YndB with AHSA1/START domain